jgi:hypothetical protein
VHDLPRLVRSALPFDLDPIVRRRIDNVRRPYGLTHRFIRSSVRLNRRKDRVRLGNFSRA